MDDKQVLDFQLKDTLLCYLGHLCVPSRKCAKMIWEAHYSYVTRHFGVEKTMVVLQKYFYWLKFQHDVGKYIRYFIVCAIAKPTIKKQGLYTPLPTPNLPSTMYGNEYVFVVMDKFSKMDILVACKKSITSEDTAKIFFELAWVNFGILHTIISNQYSRFLSTFCSILWTLLDTKLDPQMDGQT